MMVKKIGLNEKELKQHKVQERLKCRVLSQAATNHPVSQTQNQLRLRPMAYIDRESTDAIIPHSRNPQKAVSGVQKAHDIMTSSCHEMDIIMAIADSVRLGTNVKIHHPDLVNLYGCSVGDDTGIGTFVEIQKGASIGKRCKISSHTFICEGVVIADEVFVGHGVMFINDRYPRATNADGSLQTDADWRVEPTRVGHAASIGSNATIVSGVSIGAGALVGAGAVVTRDVPPHAIVAGVPARVVGDVREKRAQPLQA